MMAGNRNRARASAGEVAGCRERMGVMVRCLRRAARVRGLLLVPLLWVGGLATVSAGSPPPPVEPDIAVSFDLTESESAILREYLPNAYAKFRVRKPVHSVMIGDSVSNVFMAGSVDHMNWVRGFPYKFLDRISEQFYYTGGVRVVQPRRGYPAKALPLVGDEMTLRTMSRGGRTALYANQMILANAFEHRPDLVFLNFGINDAVDLLSLATYEASLREAIARIRLAGAEPVLLGPSPLMNTLEGMALVRTYKMAMENVARQENVWFADLGNPGWFISAPPPDSSPADRVEHALLGLRGWYGVTDWVHPNVNAHERIGLRLFKEMLGERVEGPLKLVDAWVSDLGRDGFRAHVRVMAGEHSTGDIVVAPLATNRVFVPDQPVFVLGVDEVDDDGTWLVEFDYKFSADNPGASRSMIDLLDQRRRPVIPLHWLVMDDKQVGMVDAQARIEPVAVRWDFRPVWNSPAGVSMKAELVAGSGSVKGTYRATWLGQESTGDFELAADGRKTVTLDFPIPETYQRTGRAGGALKIEFATDRGAVVLERQLSALKNMALGEGFPLELAGGDGHVGNIDLTLSATPGELKLTFDLAVGELASTIANPNAVVVELWIDAREFEQRARPGGTDPFRFVFPATSGPGNLTGLLPWGFGTGYAMDYPADGFGAGLETLDNGIHRVEITIPSSYLYLHEWALGNNDSQIGINSRVSVLQVDDENPVGGYPASARWSLLNPSGSREDGANLGRVELSETASGRWSVRLN